MIFGKTRAGGSKQDGDAKIDGHPTERGEFAHSMLRDLRSAGFNTARQGVMMAGRTRDRQIIVILRQRAILESFPKIVSSAQCVDFVERNLVALGGVVNARLVAGKMKEFALNRGWPEMALFVDLTAADLLRAKRWMSP